MRRTHVKTRKSKHDPEGSTALEILNTLEQLCNRNKRNPTTEVIVRIEHHVTRLHRLLGFNRRPERRNAR